MTTIVITRKAGEVAIAADSQTTFGDTRLSSEFDPASNKIFHLADTYFAISGSAAHDLVFQQALAGHQLSHFAGRKAIFETFRALHPRLKEDFFLKPDEDDEDPYESSQITAVLANRYGIFAVYSMREVYEYSRFWAIGSGREFALGAMYARWDDSPSALALARVGVETGATFDINSALPMTAYSLSLQLEDSAS